MKKGDNYIIFLGRESRNETISALHCPKNNYNFFFKKIEGGTVGASATIHYSKIRSTEAKTHITSGEMLLYMGRAASFKNYIYQRRHVKKYGK